MNRYTKLAADGADLPADSTGHLAVRVDNDLLARPMIWTAHRSEKALTWKQANAWAEKLGIHGWSWRLPTVEEAFLLCDRTRTARPMVPVESFPDCEGEWIWTGTEDLTPPAGYAWGVYLNSGGACCSGRSSRGHVRAVRAATQASETPAEWLKGYAEATADQMPEEQPALKQT